MAQTDFVKIGFNPRLDSYSYQGQSLTAVRMMYHITLPGKTTKSGPRFTDGDAESWSGGR